MLPDYTKSKPSSPNHDPIKHSHGHQKHVFFVIGILLWLVTIALFWFIFHQNYWYSEPHTVWFPLLVSNCEEGSLSEREDASEKDVLGLYDGVASETDRVAKKWNEFMDWHDSGNHLDEQLPLSELPSRERYRRSVGFSDGAWLTVQTVELDQTHSIQVNERNEIEARVRAQWRISKTFDIDFTVRFTINAQLDNSDKIVRIVSREIREPCHAGPEFIGIFSSSNVSSSLCHFDRGTKQAEIFVKLPLHDLQNINELLFSHAASFKLKVSQSTCGVSFLRRGCGSL
ncbi:hypothetical protein Ciccas_002398 [Cichlidogyrus casuarinus]|uniref:Uncharacterized protein n=1 Tax=Cichlidogyrus casuarinus TaxID=1844966 RepID=A0ABD2QHP5_9PLAT